jgi:hypothetical protein
METVVEEAVVKRGLVALGLAAVMVPGLSGCWSGNNAATTTQSASGDGTQITAADITIDSATLVAGDPKSGKAAFLGTVFNPTMVEDEVTSITAGGVTAKMSPDPIVIPPQQAVAIQSGKVGDAEESAASAEFASLDAAAGTYVDIVMTFKTAGEQTFSALIVPPSGFYASAAPAGTTPIPVKVNVDTGHSESEAAEPQGEGAATDEGAAMTDGATTKPSPEASPAN